MKRFPAVAVLPALFLATVVLPIVPLFLGDPPPISIDARPRVQIAPVGKATQIQLTIRVLKDAHNRVLCVEIDGGVYSSSCFPHVGLGAASQVIRTIHGVTAGGYVARATVIREDGSRRVAETTFCVAGGEGECGLGGEP